MPYGSINHKGYLDFDHVTNANRENKELQYQAYFLSLFKRKSKTITPKTIPSIPPETRFKRHRAPNFQRLNNFRHWWKTSRLLVRLSGAYVWYRYAKKVTTATINLTSHNQKILKKGLKNGLKAVKSTGRGGSTAQFLSDAHPLTRSLRIFMAVGRAFEASIDNRFLEVLIAEGMAFAGNRSARWWSRHIVDAFCKYIVFPIGLRFNNPSSFANVDWETTIVMMGLIRVVAPFASSFIGSKIGRQLTLAANDRIHFRWRAVQNVHDLVLAAGTFCPTLEDPFLIQTARLVAKAVGLGNDPSVVRASLKDIDFDVFGAGSGGHAVYRHFASLHDGRIALVILHLTPYGPSIVDEMPRFIVLERKIIRDQDVLNTNRNFIKNSLDVAKIKEDGMLFGFTYSGSFFTAQEWASLKQRYDSELLRFEQACKYMGQKIKIISRNANDFPPTDLESLKAFNRTGRTPRKRRNDKRKYSEVTNQVTHLSKKIERLKRDGKAPASVIVYMEGLDCAGKSSTGGLISDALAKAGFTMEYAQYNKPPTEEEKSYSWMWRFKKPSSKDIGKMTAIVWDRGPSGDFVYGNLNQLSPEEKREYYASFQNFEEECISQSILFFKILFITDRDSICKTLGKRLAHKKIVRDLHTWLDATSLSYHERDGLNEIENHIDPTDFIALNKYDTNLRFFYDFALHTDHLNLSAATAVADGGITTASTTTAVGDADKSTSLSQQNTRNRKCRSYYNPWVVVSTSNRHRAHLEIMKEFEKHLMDYQKYKSNHTPHNIGDVDGNGDDHNKDDIEASFKLEHKYTSIVSMGSSVGTRSNAPSYNDEVEALFSTKLEQVRENKGNLWIAIKDSWLYIVLLVVVFYSYLHQSWKIEYFWDEMEIEE